MCTMIAVIDTQFVTFNKHLSQCHIILQQKEMNIMINIMATFFFNYSNKERV